jgi:hypothetical protein
VATFNSDDWEELYAFVDVVHDAEKGQYEEAWVGWAELQNNQTAEQWRQYYEKVVRPQWLRDPEWKRVQIREKIEKKHNTDQSQSLSFSLSQQQQRDNQGQVAEAESAPAAGEPQKDTSTPQKTSDSEEKRFENERLEQLLEASRSNDEDAAAYIYYAREKKWSTRNAQPELDYSEYLYISDTLSRLIHTKAQLHKLLMDQWSSLSADAKAPYVVMNQTAKEQDQTEAPKLSSEVKLMSSSTAQYESPRYIAEIYQNVLKRVRGAGLKDKDEDTRPLKRQKSTSPAEGRTLTHGVHSGTQHPLVEIISSDSSVSSSQPEADDERADDQLRHETAQRQHADDSQHEDDFQDADQEMQSVESEDILDIDHLSPLREGLEETSEDDFPSNTPTPRAVRQRTNNFDTQAILSSPSPDIGITPLPRPAGYTQDLQTQTDHRSSSLAPHPESEASTTQSLQEFRHSLNGEDTQVSYPPLPTLPRLTSLSPAPSTSSSTGSGDPDVPLDASEFDDFFDEKLADGFSNEFITKALKRTRCRPGLAEVVLDAWAQGKPLPFQRGIWSLEDDEAVESGDGVALAKLERKHTLDGWGGITERLVFLKGYRSR